MAQDVHADLKQSVLQALSTVTDPELDEPITDLGFVKDLSVSDDGRVSLDLVTSTFWCSPNFVFMMLEEARDVVSKLPGVREAQVRLGGHHDSARINEAINSHKSFFECYGSEANGNLVELNQMIRTRALRSRLHSMAETLFKYGFSPEQLLDLSHQDMTSDGDSIEVKSPSMTLSISDAEDVKRISRYLRYRERIGPRDGPLVVWDLDGNPPKREEFRSALREARSSRANFGFNAELCRALLSARLSREADPTRSYTSDR
jgi:metal-sulfur cluster biosynthetic enzyme